HGRVQPGQQLERAAPVEAREGSHEAAPAWIGEGRNCLSWTFVSRNNAHERRTARARVQLPLWRSGNAGALAALEVRSSAAPGSDDRRQDRQLQDRVGQT